jgi:hypothetical protein
LSTISFATDKLQLIEYKPPDKSFTISIPKSWKVEENPREGLYMINSEVPLPFLLVESIRNPTTKTWDRIPDKEPLLNSFRGVFLRLLSNLIPDGEILYGDNLLEIKGKRKFGGEFKVKSTEGIIKVEILFNLYDKAMFGFFSAAKEINFGVQKIILDEMIESFKPNPSVFEIPYSKEVLEEDITHTLNSMIPGVVYDWRFKVNKVNFLQGGKEDKIKIAMQYETEYINNALEDFYRVLPYLQKGQSPPFKPKSEGDKFINFTRSFFLLMGTVVNRITASGLNIDQIIFDIHDSKGVKIRSINVKSPENLITFMVTNNSQKMFNSMKIE